MPPPRLVHHLRRHRKVAGLSQEELGRLLGWKSGDRVSKYEHFQCTPSLESAIACEIIFNTRLRDLLPNLYGHVRKRVALHATLLLDGIRDRSTSHRQAKHAFLATLANVSTSKTSRS